MISLADFNARFDPTGAGGALDARPRGALSGNGGFFDQMWPAAVGAALLGGQTFRQSLANAGTALVPALEEDKRRRAINQWLLARSKGGEIDPDSLALLQGDPTLAENFAASQISPRAPIAVARGARLYDPVSRRWVGGDAAAARGDGSAEDLAAARAAYEARYGTADNRDINAPDIRWWYSNQWPTYGTATAAPTGRQVATDQPPGSGGRNPPAVGAIEDGCRFKGGDPADPNSWELVP
jgi:hypothetical protein